MSDELSLMELLTEKVSKGRKSNNDELKYARTKSELLEKLEAFIPGPGVSWRFEVAPEALNYVIDLVSDDDVASVYDIVQENDTVFLASQRALDLGM